MLRRIRSYYWLGRESHVRFLGSVPNDELWRYYAGADLFVLPSRLESWGTVMLESLACGTPVVATETAGGCEVRQHFSDDVRLVECERPESLAEAVS
ncbi:MAG: glycosyltransferase, partial [Vicinamibacterales bacterium]|nr:glycosyltransferase [Vicinamibacterales bacterium]